MKYRKPKDDPLWEIRDFVHSVIGIPTHVLECSAGESAISKCTHLWMEEADRITLVEPRPEAVATLEADYKDNPKITIIPVAIADEPGKITLMYKNPGQGNGSTYVKGVVSPEIVIMKRHFKHEVEVDAVRFSSIDDGSIDYLIADTEGYEWYILKHILSRPRLIYI